MKKLVILLFIIGGLFLFITERSTIDLFNPFIKENTYYTKIDIPGYKGPRRLYKLIGYDLSGKKQELELTASKQLRMGAYLKVKSIGRYSTEWEEIQFNNLPQIVKQKMAEADYDSSFYTIKKEYIIQ